MRHFLGTVLAAAVFTAFVGQADGQIRRADNPPVPPLAEATVHEGPLANYLDNEVTKIEEDYVIIRCAVEINAEPARWFALDVEFRLSQAEPLLLPSGKAVVKRWNNLFTPHGPRPTRWQDCRLDVDLADLQAAENLPKDKTFVLWAMGLLYNWKDRAYVGSGWPVRTPLLLTTDAGGTIVDVRAPRLLPADLLELNPAWDQSIDVRQAKLKLDHLSVRDGTRACLVSRREGPALRVLAGPAGQAWTPSGYGRFVGPIDSAEKARELVELQLPGRVIIRTREQYDAVLAAVRKLGWVNDRDILAEPPTVGDTVTTVEGLGWRLPLVTVEPSPAGKDWLGDIVFRDVYVSTDGRVGFQPLRLIRAPAPPIDEPGWTQIAPADPGDYTRALREALQPEGHRLAADRFVSTGEIVSLKLPVAAPDDIISATNAETPADVTDVSAAPDEPDASSQPAEEPEAQSTSKNEAADEAADEAVDTGGDTAAGAAATSESAAEPTSDSNEDADGEASRVKTTEDAGATAHSDATDESGEAQPAESADALRPNSATLAQMIGKNIVEVRRNVILALPPAAIDENFDVRSNYTGEALCETADDGRYVLDFHKGVLRGVQKRPAEEK
ncbi:MAG: hypothetical protein GVY16_07015 [Planctomycetes bacterium]|nr:hypothetical protein [Planctomycetota bacterium]